VEERKEPHMRNLKLSFVRASKGALRSSMLAQKIHNARHMREPFSDSDILDLQDAFLNNGLHYIKVDDIRTGRSLVQLFLDSLNCYNNIACLSTSPESLNQSTTDLYSELILNADSSYELEEFFLEKFYYDFVWIEASEELANSFLSTELFKQMNKFKLDQLIPILVLSYKK